MDIEQLQNPTMGVTINNESTTTEPPPQNGQQLKPTGGQNAVKPILSGPSKIDKTNILMISGSLMKVKRILHNASLGALCNTFDLH